MRLPPSVHNRLSYAGATIALLALTAIVFLFILEAAGGGGDAPYAGLVIFVFLPAVLLCGLGLIPIGMILERRHVRRTGQASIPRFPVIDLNDPRHRNAALIFVLGSVLLLFLSVFGSFQAYEATESVAFCGSTCHTVMEPEKVAHRDSPHARVRCVECHVGPGAEWYVRSKLAGVHQLYAVTFDTYPRPIPVPLADLRSTRETCEHCHWREEHDAGLLLKRRIHYLPDEANTRWEIGLLVKVGGGPGEENTGTHWHLNPANRVEYIAADRERQEIPWVRVTDTLSGKSTEYLSTDSDLSADEIAAADKRVMDCLDCHNRPSHRFHAPDEALDAALQAGRIDPTLPWIKQTGVELLVADYADGAAAERAIAEGLQAFYREHDPDLGARRAADIAAATATLQDLYRRNFFPAMKVRWDAYPSNESHVAFPGCVRCHDGLHESRDGEVIGAGCTTCHIIVRQGPADDAQVSTDPDGLAFEHPPIEDLGDAWEDTPCTDCHSVP